MPPAASPGAAPPRPCPALPRLAPPAPPRFACVQKGPLHPTCDLVPHCTAPPAPQLCSAYRRSLSPSTFAGQNKLQQLQFLGEAIYHSSFVLG
ncbi:unnamed protein product [Urochloa humidicola]